MVDEIHEFGSPWFGISGGEPLVRQDIFDVIDYAQKEYGMEVSLITSGFAFDQKRLDKLVKHEVHTAVSIDGTKESNDIIRRHFLLIVYSSPVVKFPFPTPTPPSG